MSGESKVQIEPGIWKVHNHGKLSYFVQVSVRNPRGKVKRPSKQGVASNLAQARTLKHEFLEELNKHVEDGSPTTLWQFIPTYYALIDLNKRASTVLREKSNIEAHIVPHFGHISLKDITALDVENFVKTVAGNKSAQTQKHLLNHLSAIFKLAIKKRIVTENPCVTVERPKIKRKEPLVLTHEQVVKLFEYLQKNHRVLFYHVALSIHTCARAGELRALTWADIDLENNRIMIAKTLDPKTGLKPYVKNGEPRKVPINSELKSLLIELKTQTYTAPTDPALPHWREFADGEQGKPLKLICKALGLPLIRYHDLRATGITLMLLNNVSLAKVMLVAGHKRITSTQIYLRLSGLESHDATECLSFLVPHISNS